MSTAMPAIREKAMECLQTNFATSKESPSCMKPMNGEMVKAYRITDAGKMAGRSVQTIRNWEAQLTIPKPTIEKTHRYYTLNQISLLKELADLIDLLRYEGHEVLGAATANKSEEIHNLWNK